VHECFLSSFSNEKNNFNNSSITEEVNFDFENNNSLLEEEENTRRNWKINAFPTVKVNNKTLQGALHAENVLEAVCAGLSHRPGICAQIGFKVTEGENEDDDYSSSSTRLPPLLLFLIATVTVVLLYFLVYCVCWKYIARKVHERIDKSDIDGKISHVVRDYFALKDSKTAV